MALAFKPFQAELAAIAAALASLPEDAELAPKTPPPKRKGHGRRRLADEDLPEVVVRVDPSPGLGDAATALAVDVTFRVEYKRGHWARIRIERARAANGKGEPDVIASTPSRSRAPPWRDRPTTLSRS